MPTRATLEYIVRDDNIVMRETRESVVGDARTVLGINIKESFTTVKNAGTVDWLDDQTNKMRLPYHLLAGRDRTYIVTNPPTLPILCAFERLNGNRNDCGVSSGNMERQFTTKTMRPMFRGITRDDNKDNCVMPARYMYPWDMYRNAYCKNMGKLYLILEMAKTSSLCGFYPVNMHLAALDGSKFYTFGYPSQFREARMCMGGTFDEEAGHPSLLKKNTLADWVAWAWSLFLRSPASADLTTDFGKIWQWNMEDTTFQFHSWSPETYKSIAREVSREVLTIAYNGIQE
jgi:hypothetical protein